MSDWTDFRGCRITVVSNRTNLAFNRSSFILVKSRLAFDRLGTVSFTKVSSWTYHCGAIHIRTIISHWANWFSWTLRANLSIWTWKTVSFTWFRLIATLFTNYFWFCNVWTFVPSRTHFAIVFRISFMVFNMVRARWTRFRLDKASFAIMACRAWSAIDLW